MKTAISIAVGLALALLTGCAGVSTGDISRPDLAYRGGIQEVGHADYEMQVYLFIFRIFTTEDYGN